MLPRRAFVTLSVVIGFALTGLLLNTPDPRLRKWLGFDLWASVAAHDDLRHHLAEREALEAKADQFMRARELSGRVAHKLVEKQISLADAVDELEPLLRERVGFETAWPENPPPTFRHAVARYAMTRVELELVANPPRFAAVSARLRAEYDALR